jgi:choline dehydrogenase-like flavoprotein
MAIKNTVQNLSVLDSSEPFDVCIIGSGPVGTILGRSLVERGIRTVILESGSSLFRWLADSRLKNLAAYQFNGDTAYPLTHTKARLVGGNSNFWTGRCERFHPSDFERNPYTPVNNPWPITYNQLEPYYVMAEKSLRVRGGLLSKYSPWRSDALPLPPKPDISYLKSLFGEVGIAVDDSPTATPTKGLRFFRVQKEILPGFLTSPYASLVSGITVTRLLQNCDRHIIGAEARTLNHEKKNVRARLYVVACGGIETPRLLLLSSSEQSPKGIGNAYDLVGRGFNEHPGVNFYAKIRHSWGTICPTNKVGRSHQFYDQFRSEALGSVLPVFRQSWVLFHHIMTPSLSRIPKNILSIISRIMKPTLYIGATVEMQLSDTNRVVLSADKKDYFGNPLACLNFSYSGDDRKTMDRTRDLILKIFDKVGATSVSEAEVTWSRHHQSTCRMGSNPKTSVVGSNLRVHESPNLFICGSEVFVTGAAVPPVLTITALAHRLADHLASRLREG